MYVILGATGHTGSATARTLLARNQQVRAVGRSKEKLASLAAAGAELFVADINDPNVLAAAFEGATAVYAMVPPSLTSSDYRADQDRVIESMAAALEAAHVTHVVTLSSVGADKESKTGPIAGLHYMEVKFNQIPALNCLHLRAGYFMENTLPQTGAIQTFGMMAGPVRADLPISMIASRDIGVAAGEALLALDFSGHQTRELLGQRDITYTEIAKLIGNAINKPSLAYVQLPFDQIIEFMVQMGISRNLASLLCEMADGMNNGHVRALEPRSERNSTRTSFDQFVQQVFVPAYMGKAASA